MKMFWGLIFIVLGIALMVNHVLGSQLPIFKIFFGCLLIYWGLKVLTGAFGFTIIGEKRATHHEAILSKSNFVYSPDKNKFATIMGTSNLDLTAIDPQQTSEVKIDVVMGESTVRIKKGFPLFIAVDSVMSQVDLPDKNSVLVGSYVYKTENFLENQPALKIDLDIVMGKLKILFVD